MGAAWLEPGKVCEEGDRGGRTVGDGGGIGDGLDGVEEGLWERGGTARH